VKKILVAVALLTFLAFSNPVRVKAEVNPKPYLNGPIVLFDFCNNDEDGLNGVALTREDLCKILSNCSGESKKVDIDKIGIKLLEQYEKRAKIMEEARKASTKRFFISEGDQIIAYGWAPKENSKIKLKISQKEKEPQMTSGLRTLASAAVTQIINRGGNRKPVTISLVYKTATLNSPRND